jgi:MoxR-like ATPase
VRVDRRLLDDLLPRVVGRRREVELVVAALAAGRHVLLEGPPGTGKSTLLRALAAAADLGFEFVEGNAELTPARLVGAHDPARVLVEGYAPGIWVDGPLAAAMRSGALLYVEEINRVPEETLNVLITVMSERELHVPRLGRLPAADGFRLVAAMNPFDAVGTARISSAVYDRTCRLRMGYQDAADELEIVRRAAALPVPPPPTVAKVVEVVRGTREHPDVRVGASIRGAIDTVLVAGPLAELRGRPADDPAVLLDAALTALSGRVRMHEGGERTAEDVIAELWEAVFGAPGDGAPGDGEPGESGGAGGAGDGRGKAPAPAPRPPAGRGAAPPGPA